MALYKYFATVPKDAVNVAASDSGLTMHEIKLVHDTLSVVASGSGSAGKKRGKYNSYDGCKRMEVAKWGIVHGIGPAVRKYTMSESTVRGIIKSYKEKEIPTEETSNCLPKKKRGGRTLLPEEIDDKVIRMIKSLRTSGTGVTWAMTIAIATGLVAASDRTMLKENGGTIELNETWAQSIHRRLGYVKRKNTTSKQPVAPGVLKEIGFTFYRAIDAAVSAYNIPHELIINIDQTPLKFFLISDYTLTKKGEKSVPITNSCDFRQITGTYAISMAGDFLPMQLIYQGKTDRCNPNYKFPEGFQITHTENHWSNTEKSIEMVTEILMPYVKRKREELKLRKNQEWLLISDVFKAHWTDEVKDIIMKNNGKMVAVPNCMTDKFQPLDLTVNRSSKAHLRNKTHTWFGEQVQQQIQNGVTPENVKVDLKISILKPLHAKWVTSFYDYMQGRPDIILKGWKRAGITEFLERNASEKKEDPFL